MMTTKLSKFYHTSLLPFDEQDLAHEHLDGTNDLTKADVHLFAINKSFQQV